MSLRPLAMAALLVTAAVGGVAAGPVLAQQSSTSGYAGTHVGFEAQSNAVADYSVGGERVLSQVKVQSASEVESERSLTGGLSVTGVANLTGAALSVQSKSEASATVTAESGATIAAHDNAHGVLVVDANSQRQYVTADLGAEAEASAESDSQVEVTTASGTEGTFVVAGNGSVAVNDEGDVTAELDSDARLVFRTYTDGRDEAAQHNEELIANGTAAASVYVMEQDGEQVTDTVTFRENTSVEVTQRSEGAVEMTVARSAHEGKVVLTSVSEATLDASSDLDVRVDGEAAARASSYAALRQAAAGTDGQSKYMVTQQASAEASAQVAVAVSHFSERTVTMSEDDGSDTTTGDGDSGGDGSDGDGADTTTEGSDGSDTTTESSQSGGLPGFTAGAALVAVLGAVLLGRRRS